MSFWEPLHDSAFPSGDLLPLAIKMSAMLPRQTALLLMGFSTASLLQDAHCPFSGGWRGCWCWGRYWLRKTVKDDSFPLVAIPPAENAGRFLQVWTEGSLGQYLMPLLGSYYKSDGVQLRKLECTTMTDTQTTSRVLNLKEGRQHMGFQGQDGSRKKTCSHPWDPWCYYKVKVSRCQNKLSSNLFPDSFA